MFDSILMRLCEPDHFRADRAAVGVVAALWRSGDRHQDRSGPAELRFD
jgi:hypothetical protein